MPPRHPPVSGTARRLVITTLGAVEIRAEAADRTVVGRLGPGKPLAVVTYLAHLPSRTALRNHLAELLWSDVDPFAGRHALRQTLWYTKRTLGDGVFRAHGDELVLDATVECDAVAFAEAVSSNDAERATALYTGEFLPAVVIPGGAEFERWADLERQRLRAMFVRSAERVVNTLLGRGDTRAAVALARRARDADVMDERLWRRVFEALLAAQDHLGLVLEIDAFERQWALDERDPEPSTLALIRQARHQPSTDARASRALSTALVGRAEEFAALTARWEEVLGSKRPRQLHIMAPAGLGKSRLLADLRARLRASGARVVSVRANPGERAISYVFLAEIVRGLATLPGAAAVTPEEASILIGLNPALSAAFPHVSARPQETEVLRMRTLATRALLNAVAEERPLALLVDDVHWADDESRRVLAACVGSPEIGPVLFVTAARQHASGLLAGALEETCLAPLDEHAVLELVLSIGEAPKAGWMAQLPELLHRATGGSPLLVVETLVLALESGTLTLDTAGWHCPDQDALESQLASASPLAARLAGLEGDGRRLLSALSLIGRPATEQLLRQATELDDMRTRTALGALEMRGLVLRAEDILSVSHDEIADGVVSTLPPEEQEDIHGRLGRALMDGNPDDATMRRAAMHLAAARSIGDLHRLFARWMRAQRQHGDRRHARVHAEELLGGATTPALTQALVTGLPLRLRVRHLTSAAVAVAVGVIGVATVAAMMTAHQSRETVLNVVQAYGDGGPVAAARLNLTRDGWNRDDIPIDKLAPPELPPSVQAAEPNRIITPDGDGWLLAEAFRDTGGIDVIRVTAAGAVTRLTASPGDDESAVPSPDGQMLVFGTTRFDALMHTHLARMSRASGKVEQLTFGEDREFYPRWSPDGSRIEFERRSLARGRDDVCVIDVDGTHASCMADLDDPVGWIDESTILARTAGARGALVRVNLRTQRRDTLYHETLTVSLDPNREWMLVTGVLPGYDGSVSWVAPVDAPGDVRVLRAQGAPVRRAKAVWGIQPPRGASIEKVHIVHPDTIDGFASFQLAAEAYDASGHATPAGVLRWTVVDTTHASVTEGGVLVPRAEGNVAVVASTGGWRVDTARIVISTRPTRHVANGTWMPATIREHWVFFGSPQPHMIEREGRSVLFLDGDSSFTTGVRFHSTLRAPAGMVMRARVRARVTRDQWQNISLGFETAASDPVFATWDKRTGADPSPNGALPSCTFMYPSDEGHAHRAEWALHSRDGDVTRPGSPAMITGQWFIVELQMLPDGRCGVALDDVPLAISRFRQPMAGTLAAKVQAMSYHTQVLVDSLTLTEGILHPGWWARLDAEARTPGAKTRGNR